MYRTSSLLLLAAVLLALPGPAQAQQAFQVSDVKVKYTFGQQITFAARIQISGPIQEVGLFFQQEGETNVRYVPLTLASDGTTNYDYPLQQGLLRPFVRINFWFQIKLPSGETQASQQYYFDYTDNRFPWQLADDQNLKIYWYEGDAAFGQAAIDAAYKGLQAIQTLFPVDTSKPMEVYIYPTSAEVQDVLNLGGLTWVSGDASPDLGVVLVSVSPGENQTAEFERQIPHELAHVYLYRLTGPAYYNLPAWLREGLAQMVEQSPNPDYDVFLNRLKQGWTLIPIKDLCGLFPQDTTGASLAYLESYSFTRYLADTYGISSLQPLIQAYLGGASCEQGTSRATGLTVPELDARWQQAVLGKKEAGVALLNLLPYLIVLLVLLGIPVVYFAWVFRKRRSDGHDHSK